MPIERARRLLPQIQELNTPTRLQIREDFILISYGLFQKMLIGDNAGKAFDLVFSNPTVFTSPKLILHSQSCYKLSFMEKSNIKYI